MPTPTEVSILITETRVYLSYTMHKCQHTMVMQLGQKPRNKMFLLHLLETENLQESGNHSCLKNISSGFILL